MQILAGRGALLLETVRDIAKNAVMHLPPVARWRLRSPRTGPARANDPAALDRYVFSGLQLLRTHAGALEGRSILEIGPGDHLGLGLACLAAGARHYTALDRFVGPYSSDSAKEWYCAIRAAWRGPWPAWLDPERFPEGYPDHVQTAPESVEAVDAAAEVRQYDVVCSMAVGEHVSDIAAFARACRRMLAPGGIAVHAIDFSQHGYEAYGDPDLFLRFPDWLWSMMGSARGLPNRHRAHEFTRAFQDAGLSVALHDVHHLPVREPRRLARRFRAMPAEALAVRYATVVCRPTK